MIVKICKIKTKSEVALLAHFDVDLIGIHYLVGEKNPSLKNAADLAAFSRSIHGPGIVILTKTLDISIILDIVRRCQPDFLQIHRPTTLDELNEIHDAINSEGLTEVLIIPVASAEEADYPNVIQVANHPLSFLTIIDSSFRGGTNTLGAADQIVELSTNLGGNFILAGGLSAENILGMLEKYNPLGIDIQSSVQDVATKEKSFSKIFDLVTTLSKAGITKGNRKQYEFSVALHNHTSEARIAELVRSGIVHYHIDVADGSSTPEFISNPISQSFALGKNSRSAFYDLHIYSNDLDQCRIFVESHSKLNPNIRHLLIHCESSAAIDSTFKIIHHFLTLSFRVGISIHVTKLSPLQAVGIWEMGCQAGAVSFGTILPSKAHAFAKSAEWLGDFSAMISSQIKSKDLFCPIWVDRDVNSCKFWFSKLNGFNGIVAGKWAANKSGDDLLKLIIKWKKAPGGAFCFSRSVSG